MPRLGFRGLMCFEEIPCDMQHPALEFVQTKMSDPLQILPVGRHVFQFHFGSTCAELRLRPKCQIWFDERETLLSHNSLKNNRLAQG